MNIVFLALYNSGGIFGTLTKAINKYTEHHADFILKKRHRYKFDYDICETEGYKREDGNSFNNEDIKRILNNADVIHRNMCAGRFSRIFGINIEPYFNNVKTRAFHFSGYELRNQPGRWDHLKGIKIVDNLDLLQYIKNGHWLPNPVPTNNKLYTPDPFRSIYTLRFCTDISVPSKWGGHKGLSLYADIIKDKIRKYNSKVSLDIINEVTRNECLERKRKCHVYAGELFLPNYENSVLECTSQSLVIINKHILHPEIYNNPPFIFIEKKDLDKTIEKLINTPMKEIFNIGRKTREWCVSFHDDKIVIKKLISLYEEYK